MDGLAKYKEWAFPIAAVAFVLLMLWGMSIPKNDPNLSDNSSNQIQDTANLTEETLFYGVSLRLDKSWVTSSDYNRLVVSSPKAPSTATDKVPTSSEPRITIDVYANGATKNLGQLNAAGGLSGSVSDWHSTSNRQLDGNISVVQYEKRNSSDKPVSSLIMGNKEDPKAGFAITVNYGGVFSERIAKELFEIVSFDPNPARTGAAIPRQDLPEENRVTDTASARESQAVQAAKDIVNSCGISEKGLVKELEKRQYSHSEAVYGASHCDADWNKQAHISARGYYLLDMTEKEIISNLTEDGYTTSQIDYGIKNMKKRI